MKFFLVFLTFFLFTAPTWGYDFTDKKINVNPVSTQEWKSDQDFVKNFTTNESIRIQTSAMAGEPIYLVFKNAVLAGDFKRGVQAPSSMNYGMIAKDGYIREVINNKVTGLTGTRIPKDGYFELNGKLFFGFVPEKWSGGIGCYNLQINLEKAPPSEPNVPVSPPTTEPPYKEKIVEKTYKEYKETIVQQTIVAGNMSANPPLIHHIQPIYQPGLVLTSVFGSLFWYNPINCSDTEKPNNDPNGCGSIPPGLVDDDGGPPDIDDVPDGIINTPEPVGTISDPIPVNPTGGTPTPPSNPVAPPANQNTPPGGIVPDIPSGILKSR